MSSRLIYGAGPVSKQHKPIDSSPREGLLDSEATVYDRSRKVDSSRRPEIWNSTPALRSRLRRIELTSSIRCGAGPPGIGTVQVEWMVTIIRGSSMILPIIRRCLGCHGTPCNNHTCHLAAQQSTFGGHPYSQHARGRCPFLRTVEAPICQTTRPMNTRPSHPSKAVRCRARGYNISHHFLQSHCARSHPQSIHTNGSLNSSSSNSNNSPSMLPTLSTTSTSKVKHRPHIR